MARPNGVVDTQFDDAGFEVPFAGSYEDESPGDSGGTFAAEADTPFAESTFERDASDEADSWPQAPGGEAQPGENDETLAWLDVEAPGGERFDEDLAEAEYAEEPESEAHSPLALSDRLVPDSGFGSLTSEATTESWPGRDETEAEEAPPTVDGLVTFTAKVLPVKIAVFVSPAAQRTSKVDVLFFVHGLDVCKPVLKNRPATFITHPPFHLANVVNASGRPVVLVVPHFDWEHLEQNKMGFGNRWHKIARPDLLNAVIAEAVERAAPLVGGTRPAIERLILAGHSRAFGFFDALARYHAHPAMKDGALQRLTHVWALDSTYTSPIADWAVWIKSRDSINATVIYRYGIYLNRKKEKVPLSTGVHGKRFDGIAKTTGGRLTVVPVAAGQIDHCGLPGKYLPALLESLPLFKATSSEAWSEGEEEAVDAGEAESYAGLAEDTLVGHESDAFERMNEEMTSFETRGPLDTAEMTGHDALEAMDVHELEDSEEQFDTEAGLSAADQGEQGEEEEEALEERDTARASALESRGLSPAELKSVQITSTLETGRRGGFFGLTGNFDGQGLSFGLVNWTIGTGSLQPLLREFAAKEPARWRRIFGSDAASFLALISRSGKQAIAEQLRFAVDQMNGQKVVKGKRRWFIKEPWAGYFKGLSEDSAFQQIQVRAIRDLLDRARYFCELFALKSERAFAYMFDAVSSHGKWWLTKKFADGVQKRRVLLAAKLKALEALHGKGRVPEQDILFAIADVLAATSLERFRQQVRARKRWFVTGQHTRAAELQDIRPRADLPYATSAARSVAPNVVPERWSEAQSADGEIAIVEAETSALAQATTAGTKADRDAIASTLIANGTSPAKWFGQVVSDASFLGRRIRASGGSAPGVHRTFLEALRQAERVLLEKHPGRTLEQLGRDFGIYDIAGIRPPMKATGGTLPSYHCFGLAVDINHDTNPFVGNMKPKAGSSKFKEYTANRSPAIIGRAMWLLHGERFNVEKPETIAEEAGRAWDQHHRASQALATYLRLADELEGERLRALVSAARGRGDVNDLAWWKTRVKTDRAVIKHWDFQHHPRPHQLGYLDLPREVVVALVEAGLTWGGQYRTAKDIMHFDLRNPLRHR